MREHRGQISIGEDEWLPCFDLDDSEEAMEIDLLLHDTEQIWYALETRCVSECCGLDAYGLWPEEIRKAAKPLDVTAAIKKLERLRSAIDESPAVLLRSGILNSYFHRQEFLMLLDHLLRSFSDAREA